MVKYPQEIYNMIDETLSKLQKSPGGDTLSFSQYDNYAQESMELLKEHDLVRFRSSTAFSIVDITANGRMVIDIGGFEAYINNLEFQKNQKQQRDTLEFEKLTKELNLLTKQVKDYKTNKWISIAAIAISLVALLLQLFSTSFKDLWKN